MQAASLGAHGGMPAIGLSALAVVLVTGLLCFPDVHTPAGQGAKRAAVTGRGDAPAPAPAPAAAAPRPAPLARVESLPDYEEAADEEWEGEGEGQGGEDAAWEGEEYQGYGWWCVVCVCDAVANPCELFCVHLQTDTLLLSQLQHCPRGAGF